MEAEKYILEFSNMVGEIERFLKLNEENPGDKNFFQKNLEMLKDIVLSGYKNMTDGISNGISAFEHILAPAEQFLAAADKADHEKMRESYQTLLKYKHEFANLEKARGNKIVDVFQIDLKEMEIHQAKVKALQELVDYDLQIYGGVVQTTLEVLDVQHYELIDNRMVWEKGVYDNMPDKEYVQEQEHSDPIQEDKETMPEMDMQQQSESPFQTKQPYKANVYMKSSGEKNQKARVIYGNSPEDILATLQRWNKGRADNMKFKDCYVSKLNPETSQYENLAKYDVATGQDITPIYLNLPHMERNDFINTVDQLKKDGARYNPVKKNFFITKQMDLNKFSKYLPKDSISSKLNQNKDITGTVKEGGEPAKAERDYLR